jgi:hypothetical protein
MTPLASELEEKRLEAKRDVSLVVTEACLCETTVSSVQGLPHQNTAWAFDGCFFLRALCFFRQNALFNALFSVFFEVLEKEKS